jgi:hypothetical protein
MCGQFRRICIRILPCSACVLHSGSLWISPYPAKRAVYASQNLGNAAYQRRGVSAKSLFRLFQISVYYI